ncbi:MAG: hypothetical protein U0794_12060 [Isosphaeraceae bacterium]
MAGRGGGALYATQNAPAPLALFPGTAEVHRGDLLGHRRDRTLEPEEVADVSAQVMGSILEFGHDPTT